jgi:hypothetical protein
MVDIAAWLAPNSVPIGLRNTPKLYVIPKPTNETKNAARTISHARGESIPPFGLGDMRKLPSRKKLQSPKNTSSLAHAQED